MKGLINPFWGSGFDGPATRWRIHITANQDAGVAVSGLNELQFMETEFEPNLVSGGTPSADTEGGSEPASAGFDHEYRYNVPGDYWTSTNTALPHWLEYQFPSPVSINAIAIHARDTANLTQAPKTFSIQAFDGSTWHAVWTVSGFVWTLHSEFARFVRPGFETAPYTGAPPRGTHEYWRIYIIEDEAATSSMIAEIEMRATPGGADLCTGGTPSASTTNGGNVAANAFDNNNATSWQSTSPGEGQWVMYQFAAPVQVVEITVRGHSSDNNTQPRRFLLQFADSSSGPWTTVIPVVGDGSTGWIGGEARSSIDPDYIGTGTWTPASITTAAWYDASDSNNVTLTGADVDQWDDLSGNANHVVQATAGNKPDYTTSGSQQIDGKNTISFDGSDDVLAKATIAAFPANNSSAISWAAVFRTRQATDSGFWDFSPDANTNRTALQLIATGSMAVRCGSSGNAAGTAFSDATNPHLWSGTCSRTNRQIRQNGGVAFQSVTALTEFAYTNMRIGMLFGDTLPMLGDFGEIVFWTGADDYTRETVEGYLAHKWGLEGSLPSYHRFKAAPP